METDDSTDGIDWMAAYAETDDVNSRYRLLRREAKRLRGRAERLEGRY